MDVFNERLHFREKIMVGHSMNVGRKNWFNGKSAGNLMPFIRLLNMLLKRRIRWVISFKLWCMRAHSQYSSCKRDREKGEEPYPTRRTMFAGMRTKADM